mgnify:FL=1
MNFKSGFVSIIGRPNVGKSTLINKIIGEKAAIVSSKPQTTRNQLRGIYTEERGQIIFVDTPGIHKAKNELDKYMLDQAFESLDGIDLIIFMVDGTSPPGKGDNFIRKQLKGIDTPVIVVMNKIDHLNNETLFKRLEDYEVKTGREVIPVSASQGKNVSNLVDNIIEKLLESPQFYTEDMYTDQWK